MIVPAVSDRNFTPTFKPGLLANGTSGMVELLQMDVPVPDPAATTIEQLLVTVLLAGFPEASTAWAVKLEVPDARGVPVITPPNPASGPTATIPSGSSRRRAALRHSRSTGTDAAPTCPAFAGPGRQGRAAQRRPDGSPRHLHLMVFPDREAIGSRLFRRTDFDEAVVRLQAHKTSAAAPVTCGVAIDVPLRYA